VYYISGESSHVRDTRSDEISFGSLQYPPNKEQLTILFDVLDAMEMPYIMAQGQPPDDCKAILLARVAESQGRGLLCPWAPQWNVLNHPATLAFFSHGGSNSAIEAILCRQPMSKYSFPGYRRESAKD
jgi:hypothetical protein